MPEFDTPEERRDSMADLILRNSNKVSISDLEMGGEVGLEVKFQGGLLNQTGSLRDILRGKRDRWEVHQLTAPEWGLIKAALIVKEIDDD